MHLHTDSETIRYPLTNDLVFALVMNDAGLCRQLLERIFPERRIRDLRLGEGSNAGIQKTIITGLVSKSVRLDLLFEDEDRWFDVELQTTGDPALPRRGRYYASAMDIEQIHRGGSYGELKQSFVIFICTFDYYGKGEAVYRFENYDRKNNLPFGDGSFKIIVNTAAPRENTPAELAAFFDYVKDMEVPEEDGFIRELHRRVETYNTSEWRRRLMTLEEKIRMEKDLAYEQGQKEGLKEGKAEGLKEGVSTANLETARKMKARGFSRKDIVEITGLTEEEIQQL